MVGRGPPTQRGGLGTAPDDHAVRPDLLADNAPNLGKVVDKRKTTKHNVEASTALRKALPSTTVEMTVPGRPKGRPQRPAIQKSPTALWNKPTVMPSSAYPSEHINPAATQPAIGTPG